jgi:hypothetical protein
MTTSQLGNQVRLNSRPIDIALEFENGKILIDTVLENVVEIANHVLGNISNISDIDKLPIKAEDLPFQITEKFITHLIHESASIASSKCIHLKETTIKTVENFFQEHFRLFREKNPPKEAIDLLNIKSRGENVLPNLKVYWQRKYDEHSKLFEKIDLQESQKSLSCFLYVFDRLKILDAAKQYFFQITTEQPKPLPNLKLNMITNQDCVHFLLSQQYQPANVPLQKNDILVYYSEPNKPSHAALVADETHMLYGKFGNSTPFAYKHNIQLTPLMYGKQYLILRKI